MNNMDYLSHYGIKGQKWGIRRYQNEDGTYTEEGKARLSRDYKMKSDYYGKGAAELMQPGRDHELELRRKYNKYEDKNRQAKMEKTSKKLLGQAQANDDLDEYVSKNFDKINRKYEKHKDTMTVIDDPENDREETVFVDKSARRAKLSKYYKAKARGASTIQAFFEAYTYLPGKLITNISNKRHYGTTDIKGRY